MENKVVSTAILTCPRCNKEQEVEMPSNYCQILHKCQYCGDTIQPKKGDCCVFCSYANVKCPDKQQEDLE